MPHRVVRFLRRAWVAWIALGLAAALFLIGLHRISPWKTDAFTNNVFVEIIGVLIAVAVAVAWVVFERVSKVGAS